MIFIRRVRDLQADIEHLRDIIQARDATIAELRDRLEVKTVACHETTRRYAAALRALRSVMRRHQCEAIWIREKT